MATSLKDFLDDTHFAIIAATITDGEDDPVSGAIKYLNQLAAAQDDLDRCTLVNRLRDRIAAQGRFDPSHGAYDDLLPG